MVSISSPKNSIRTGCGRVGGKKTSMMPPRTANSPRSITKSTRVYAFSTSLRDASSRGSSSPWENTSGSTSPKPATTGWMRERTGMTRMRMGPNSVLPSSGCFSLRNTAMRLATVSARGESRSWGRVSHASSCATSFGSPSYQERMDSTASSASRLEATTSTTGCLPAAPAASAGRRPSGTPTVMLGSMSDSGSSISPAMSARKSSSVSSTSRMPASEPAVGSCGGCAGDVGSAAIESLLGFGETVEDDGFGRVGTVGEEFGELLALVRSEAPSTQFTVLSCAWAPRWAWPTPMRTRAYFEVPSERSMDLMPLCPPAEPPALTLILPKSRSMSSWITTIWSGSIW